MKGSFERRSTSMNSLIKVRAYGELYNLIEKYRIIIINLEKGRLYKEKNFYLNEDN